MPGPGRQFQKGEVHNPGGRPKRLAELSTKIREMEPMMLARLQDIAQNAEPKDAVAAMKLLMGYGYGAPHQTVSGEDGAAIGLVLLPAEKSE